MVFEVETLHRKETVYVEDGTEDGAEKILEKQGIERETKSSRSKFYLLRWSKKTKKKKGTKKRRGERR